MADLRQGEVIVLAGAHDGFRFLTGVYRATRDLDLDALVAEFSAMSADARSDPVAPLTGEVGDAAAVAGCYAWLVAQGLLAPVEARVLEVETVDPHVDGRTVRATVSAPVSPEGIPASVMTAWTAAAAAIVNGSRLGNLRRGVTMKPYMPAISEILLGHGLRWDDDAQREVSERYVLPRLSRPDRDDVDFDSATAAQVLRLAWAVATDDPEAVPAGERRFLATALGTRSDFVVRMSALRGPPPRQPDTPMSVDFPVVGAPVRGRRTLGTGRHVIEPVDAVDAPLVARLAPTMGGRGPAPTDLEGIDVRLVDGVPYRQVLAPGSWEPVTVDGFVEACARGAAWRDDPFHPARGRELLGPADVTRGPRRDGCDEHLAAAGPPRRGGSSRSTASSTGPVGGP